MYGITRIIYMEIWIQKTKSNTTLLKLIPVEAVVIYLYIDLTTTSVTFCGIAPSHGDLGLGLGLYRVKGNSHYALRPF